jgi:hypothetical protein
MNWIQFYNEPKFEVIEHFKYTGPLTKKELETMWSNFQYYSVKVKFPKDFDIKRLKGRFTTNYGRNGSYYTAHFEIVNVRGLSTGGNYKILKLEVEGLELTDVPLQYQRDFIIADLIEDEN